MWNILISVIYIWVRVWIAFKWLQFSLLSLSLSFSLCYNSLIFTLILHKAPTTALFIIDKWIDRSKNAILAAAHLGSQPAARNRRCSPEASNKMSLTPKFRAVTTGRFHRNSQECRDVGQLVGFRVVDSDIRGSLDSTLSTSPRIAIINSYAILMRRKKEVELDVTFLCACKNYSVSSINFSSRGEKNYGCLFFRLSQSYFRNIYIYYYTTSLLSLDIFR